MSSRGSTPICLILCESPSSSTKRIASMTRNHAPDRRGRDRQLVGVRAADVADRERRARGSDIAGEVGIGVAEGVGELLYSAGKTLVLNALRLGGTARASSGCRSGPATRRPARSAR